MSDIKNALQGPFRIVFLVFAALFLVGVIIQVYLAGMVVVAGQIGWDNHISLGHTLGLPLLVMLIAAYVGRLPGRVKLLNWLLLGVYILQADIVIFMRGSAPLVSAIHPVLALVDFALGLMLVRGAWFAVRENSLVSAIPTGLQTPASD